MHTVGCYCRVAAGRRWWWFRGLPWLVETVPGSSRSVELVWVAAAAPEPPSAEDLVFCPALSRLFL